jgi:choline dehydrogenase-like flavoprotein
MSNNFDHDWLIIGSGFGGSVSALRLAEKGYRVAMLEAGRRYRDEDHASNTWQLGKFFWAPFLGLHGIMRLTPFKAFLHTQVSSMSGSRMKRSPVAQSMTRCKPIQIVLTPGSPSPLRARKPPSMAMRRITSLSRGGAFGGAFFVNT